MERRRAAHERQVDRCQVYVGRTQIDARPVVSKGAPSSVPFHFRDPRVRGEGRDLVEGLRSPDAYLPMVCPWPFSGQIVQLDLAVKGLILLARPKRFELLTPRFVVWCR